MNNTLKSEAVRDAVKTIQLIGIGPGDDQYLTLQAIHAMQQAAVFFLLEKAGRGKEALVNRRREMLARFAGERDYRIVVVPSPPRTMTASGYQEGVREWHQQKRALFANLIDNQLHPGEHGAFLIWGDPSLYDQTVSLIAEQVATAPETLKLEMIPGITSVQALTAKHCIPLNRVGENIAIVPGRYAETCDLDAIDNAVVMLDYNASFQRFQGQDFDLYWAGDLGGADETLLAGPLDDICATVLETKAALRARKGWLMDIYLLRKRRGKVES